MVIDTQVLDAKQRKSDSQAEDGVVFVRLVAPDCWVLTVDHRVFYIHRQRTRRMSDCHAFDCHDPWPPDKGIA
ncbi:MAG: hypothetical protein A4E19_19845 [Nitrospira sp. SG-bin1]|nr:MAG: hypothetical protein A4E19_19845 [Nitrospira sp. SG-bin1]